MKGLRSRLLSSLVVVTSLVCAMLGAGAVPALADSALPSANWPHTGSNPMAVAENVLTGKVYTANSDNTLTVYDAATHTTSTVNLPGSCGPAAMAVDPNLNRVYVTCSGLAKLAVIDAGNSNTVSTVTVGTNPRAVAVNAVTGQVYVTNQNDATVTVVAPDLTPTNVNVGSVPVAVAVDATAGVTYVANSGDGTVTIIDSGNLTSSVTVGASPMAIAVNPTNGKVYVSKADNTVSVIDTKNANATSSVTVGTTPLAIAVNPVTNVAYVVNQGSGTVTAIDSTGTTATVTVGPSPQAIAVSALTNRVYVTSPSVNFIAVIDAANANATSTVSMGNYPGPITYDPLRNRIYVANQSTKTLGIIDGALNTVTEVNPSGDWARSVAVNPVTHKAYVANYLTYSVAVVDPSTNNVTTVSTGTGKPTNFIAVNPLTNKLYISAADLAVMDGTNAVTTHARPGYYNWVSDVAVNPVTNKVYGAVKALLGDGGYLMVADGSNGDAVTYIAAGSSAASVAVNPVTNRIYLSDSADGTVRVYDGGTDQLLTTIPSVGTSLGRVAVNPTTNKVYVLTQDGVTVIDGATNTILATVSSISVKNDISVDPVHNKVYVAHSYPSITIIDNSEVGTEDSVNDPIYCGSVYADPVTGKYYAGCRDASSRQAFIDVRDMATRNRVDSSTNQSGYSDWQIAADPMLGRVYAPETSPANIAILTEKNIQTMPLTVAVTPLPGNTSSGPTPSIDYQVSGGTAHKVYYQVDTWTGTWQPSTPSPSTGTISLPGLSRGLHTLYLFAADGQENGSSPVLGAMTAYLFLNDPPAVDGAGTITVAESTVPASNSNTTLHFTYTAPSVGGLVSGSVEITPPPAWGAPASCSGASIASGKILASSLNVSAARTASFSCTWSTSPSAGTSTFTVKEASTASGTLTALASPNLSVTAMSLGADPASLTSAGTVTFTASPVGSLSGTPTLTITRPDSSTTTVTLTQSGSDWSGSYDVTDTALNGTYTATFSGTTTTGGSVSASTTFDVGIPAVFTVTPDTTSLTAAGTVTIDVASDRALAAAPTLKITPPGSSTQQAITLSAGTAANTWTGSYDVTDSAANGTYTLDVSGTAAGGGAAASTGTASFIVGLPAAFTITASSSSVTAAGTVTIDVASDRALTGTPSLTLTLPDSTTQTITLSAGTSANTWTGSYDVTDSAANGTYTLDVSGTAAGGGAASSTGSGSFAVGIPAVFTVTPSSSSVHAAGTVSITVSSDRSLTGTPTLKITPPGSGTQQAITLSAGTSANTWTGSYSVASSAANGTYALDVSGTAAGGGAASSTGTGSFAVGLPAVFTVTPDSSSVSAAGTVTIDVASDRALTGTPSLTLILPDSTTQTITLSAGTSANTWTGSYNVTSSAANGTYFLSVSGTAAGGGAATSHGTASFTVGLPAAFTVTPDSSSVTAAGTVTIDVASDRALTATPTLTLTLPDSTTQTITLSAGTSANTWTGSYDVTDSAANGTYTLDVSGTAAGGGAASSTGSGSFAVGIPAVFTVTPSSSSVTAAGTVTIDVASDRALTGTPTLTLTLPDSTTQTITLSAGTSANTWTGSYDVTASTDNGTYTLDVSGTAAGGGAASSTGSGSFTVGIPAVFTVTPGSTSVTAAGSVSITVSSDRPLTATPTLKITPPGSSTQQAITLSAGTSANTWTGTYSVTSSAANGAYALSVSGTAAGGGAAASTGSGSFTVGLPAVFTVTPDSSSVTVAGTVAIDVASDRALTATPTLTLTLPDSTTQTITLSAGTSANTWTGSYDVTASSDNGTYTLDVSGTAAGGGAASSTGTGSFAVGLPAVFTVTPSSTSVTAAGTVTVTVSSDRALTGAPSLTLTLPDSTTETITLSAGTSANTWTGSYDVTASSDNGTYTLDVSGTAAGGGAAASTGTGSFAVGIPAVFTVTPGSTSVTAAGSVSITVSSDRPLTATPTLKITPPGSSTQQSITLTAGTSANTWTGSYNVTSGSANGTYALSVSGTAAGGGAATSTGTASFDVSLPAVLTITPSSTSVTVGQTVALTVHSDRALTAAPTLTLTLPDSTTQTITLSAGTSANTWTGSVSVTRQGTYSVGVSGTGVGSPSASTATASFQAVAPPPPPPSSTPPTPTNPPAPETTTTTTSDGHTQVTVTESGDTAQTKITSDTSLTVSVGGTASVDLPAGAVTVSTEPPADGHPTDTTPSAPPVTVQVKMSVLPLTQLPGTATSESTGSTGETPAPALPNHLQAQTAIEINATVTVPGTGTTTSGQSVHQLAKPVTISFKVDPKVLAQAAQAVVAYYDPELKIWVQLPTTIDPVTGTISTTVSHFTTFAVFTGRQTTSSLAPLPTGTTKESVVGVSGTGLKGTTITIYDNGKPRSTVSMPDAGSWHANLDLEPGANRLVVVAAEAGGSLGLGESTVTYVVPTKPTQDGTTTNPPPTPKPSTLSDLAGYDWAQAAITDLVSKQIMRPYDDATFKPGASVSRAAFVDALVRALHLTGSKPLAFKDQAEIPADMRETVAIAVANGLITGYPDGTLRPNDLLTRAQAAVLLARALKVAPIAQVASPVRLADAAALPDWATSGIEEVITHGLMKGYDDGAFHPNDNLTRAQVAVLIERYLQFLAAR